MNEISININNVKKEFIAKVNKAQLASLNDLTLKVPKEKELELTILKKWFNLVAEFQFLDNIPSNIEEISIHSPAVIVYKTSNSKTCSDSDITSDDLELAFEYLCLKNNISWNYKNPFVSFQTNLFDRDVRVSLSHHSISSHRQSSCFIRFKTKKELKLQDFYFPSALDAKELIKKKKNILIAGSTGSGKTSFLNSFLSLVNQQEHIIILEDTFEITKPHANCTQLLSQDEELKTLNQYMKNAMRMSPDRIVLGEIRAKEVEPFLLAMNTGHNGLISTIHANSAKDALSRIALLFKIYCPQELSYELVLKLVCQNIDFVIFLQDKKVDKIINVFGSEGENIFFDEIY